MTDADKEDLSIFDNIVYLLTNEGVEHEVLEHDFVHRSEDAAKVRGTRLEEAAKALVFKDRTNDRLFMCVISGHRKADPKKMKAILNSRDISLAHPDDVLATTGCKIGTVPPFPMLFGLRGYCDEAVLANTYVVFSAGSHYKSIRMRSEDWKELAGVELADIGKDV